MPFIDFLKCRKRVLSSIFKFMTLITLSFSIAAYFVIHSVLSANKVKLWLNETIIAKKYYRLFFNVVATVGLLIICIFYLLVEKVLLLKNEWLHWPGLLLIISGLVWVLKAMKGYHLGEFLGTYQLKFGTQPKNIELVVNGLNAQVRHPLYFGTLLILWGMFFIIPNDAAFAVATLSTLYIFIGATLEERKLEQQFGETYRLYKRHVPMLIPFCWRSSAK